MATLRLEIVAPEARIYSEDVDMVTLPGVEGEMGIYPMHVPLMTQISSGELIAKKGGQDHFLAIGIFKLYIFNFDRVLHFIKLCQLILIMCN